MVARRAGAGLAGGWLVRSRVAAGLTQERLAARSGVSVRTISDIERGVAARPYPRSIRLLAQALGLPEGAAEEVIASYRKGSGPTRPGSWTADDNAAGLSGSGGGSAMAGGREWPAPRCLPAGVSHFTGRAAELALLAGLLDDAGGADGTVVISAISGTAGVGKTALALHWAHQAAARFPDGQLHAGLRGFDQSGAPVAPGETLAEWLSVLGIPAAQIPPGAAGRAALYRSLLAGKRMLIVLDDARDEQQVRPLLPGSPGCLVIITSRNQLSGLAASHGARLLPLGLLCQADACRLLTARLGGERTAAEPQAVTEIVHLCAFLPLALAITAARAAANPRLPLAALAAELADMRSRLDVLDAGDPAASIRAVFSWSYQSLTEPARQMFRFLGLHPGPDISVPAAASLAATTVVEARRNLEELTRANLATEHVPGRYAFHDLLRAYAARQAEAHESAHARHAALGRVLDHYLHTAVTADRLLNPRRDPIPLGPLQPSTIPESFAEYHQAMAWFEAEHTVLLAAVTLAASQGFDTRAWQLAWALASYLDRRGHWRDWETLQRTAVAAASRLSDRAAQALSRRGLGHVYVVLGSYQEAQDQFDYALRLYVGLGDQVGQARVCHDIAWSYGKQGRYQQALEHCQQSLRLARHAGHRAAEATALNAAGWFSAHLGNHQDALASCRQALGLDRDLGDRHRQAQDWDSIGYAYDRLGDHAKAISCYRHALRLFCEVADRYGQARTLARLGDCCYAAGQPRAARDARRQALAILDDLRHPDAFQVRATLIRPRATVDFGD